MKIKKRERKFFIESYSRLIWNRVGLGVEFYRDPNDWVEIGISCTLLVWHFGIYFYLFFLKDKYT